MAAPGSKDLLQLLANPTNRALLSVLALEPQYPRRLAELVGLTEHEASRRLRAFEKLGLAEAAWAHVGKTVRLYRLATTKFEVSLGERGLSVTGLASARGRVELGAVAETPPALTEFVGRDQELADLRRLLDQHRAAVVQGLGGVGKTALAVALARNLGVPLLWHTVSPGESGPLLIGRLAANARALDGGEAAQRLAMLNAAEDASALLAAVAESVERLGALVVLDRFEHVADGAADAAAELAGRLVRGRLVVTTRAWPREFARDRVGALALGGLAADDALALLARAGVRGEAARSLARRTAGHPLALRLLAAAGPSSASAAADAPPFEESALREFLLQDVLPQLGDAERDVLLRLSLLRAPFLAEEAEAVAASKSTLVGLARLEARGLVLRSGETFLVHDLVRAYAAGAVPERKQVHARAAKALLASGEALKALEALHHMVEAGQHEKALGLVRDEATKATYRFADLGLAGPYRATLQRLVAVTPARGSLRAPAEVELGVLALLGGDVDAARRHLEGVGPLLDGKDEPLLAAHALAHGLLLTFEGKPGEADARFADAERRAQRLGDDRLLMDALLQRALTRESQGHPPSLDLYRRAAEAGRRSSDMRLLSVALSGEARIMSLAGDPGAMDRAREALHLARLAGYPRGEASAYMTLITGAQMSGERTVPVEYSERYLELAQRLGDPFMRTCALTDTAYFLALDGRHEEALRRAREGITLALTIKSPLFATSGAYAAAMALVGLGRPQEAATELAPYADPLHPEVAPWPAVAAVALDVMGSVHDALGDAARGAAFRRDAATYRARAPPGAPQPVGEAAPLPSPRSASSSRKSSKPTKAPKPPQPPRGSSAPNAKRAAAPKPARAAAPGKSARTAGRSARRRA